MSFSDHFYEKWKTKSTDNRRFFVEKDSLKEQSEETGKLLSSTVLNDHTQTDTFSLRLSESYVDETQESVELKTKSKEPDEIILISDSSSSDESIFSYNKFNTKNEINSKSCTRNKKLTVGSSNDESPKTPFQTKTSERLEMVQAVVEDGDAELEPSKLPELLRETIIESITLSDRKKKEILQWLSNNIDSSRCGSSCSQDSAIAESRKSGISSGNSSLERLEQNFETPNNRGKLSKSNRVERSKKVNQNNDNQQSRIDEYFTTSKKCQLDIVKDRTPGSKNSDRTPVNRTRINSRKIKLSESESLDSKTPCSTNSNRLLNSKKINSRKVFDHESKLDNLSTPKNINFRIASDRIKSSTKKKITGSRNYDPFSSQELDSVGTITNFKKVITETESDSSISETSESRNSLEIAKDFRKVIIPESQSFESTDDISNNIQKSNSQSELPTCKQSSTDRLKVNKLTPLNITEDLSGPEEIEKSQLENINQSVTNITTADTTINDCADILENLYGATWRNKVNSLVTASEPKKRTTRKIHNEVQTEKKVTSKKPQFDLVSIKSKLSNKENEFNKPKRISQTSVKKTKVRTKFKSSFINDESTTESSPECSFYTALSNPVSSQNNQLKIQTASTKEVNNRINQEKILEICDSESDVENDVWRTREINQRKLSFDSSSSSSTSEFDPEDVVPPKPTTEGIKIKKCVNQDVTKRNLVQAKNDLRKSFLASLSKDVPLENADFRAMVYRVKYNTMKEELVRVLYQLFNEQVFENKLPNDMSIEWSARLRGTAGKCYNKQSLKALGKTVRSSRIILATKILDSPDRLRDTLIHEMCHAATWLINNVSDGHGSFWKAWASKAVKAFPELPPISRCHNYEIQTKYTYKCTSCGYSIGRHSKSLDLNKKRCGYCHGKFELLINKVTKAGNIQKKSTAQTREPTGFALFVKENYQAVKQSGSAVKHGDVMKILGQQFSAVKITPKPRNQIQNNDRESP